MKGRINKYAEHKWEVLLEFMWVDDWKEQRVLAYFVFFFLHDRQAARVYLAVFWLTSFLIVSGGIAGCWEVPLGVLSVWGVVDITVSGLKLVKSLAPQDMQYESMLPQVSCHRLAGSEKCESCQNDS